MKLTIFIGGLSGGGAERVVCNLANYLTENGHIVEILTMSDDVPSYHLEESIQRIELLKQSERCNPVMNFLKRIVRLKKYMKTSDTDKYLVMLPTTTLILLMMHQYTKVPIVVSERTDPARLAWWKQFLLARLVKYASGFVFQTEEVCKWYERYIGDIKTKVIPNAIDSEFVNDTRICKQRDRKIISVGRLNTEKNYPLLINSFAKLHLEFPEYRLVIYGEGPKRKELEELVRERNVIGYVDMPGFVFDVSKKIYDSAVFVLPSNFEGMPNSLIEAMALGIPCIATDCPVGGPRFLIQNGVNGLLIPIRGEKELIKALRDVLGNHDFAEKIGRNAKCIREQLAPKKVYAQWEEFLTGIAEK